MKMRMLALALVAAAAALHVLVTMPLQRRAAVDGDEYRRLRDVRRQVQSRLARLERAESLRRQAAGVFNAAGPEDVIRLVRRSLIGSLEGAAVSKVRMSVRPGGREQVAVAVTLNAEGDFEDVVRLSGHVARTGSGLVLQTVTFLQQRPAVGLELEAVGLSGGARREPAASRGSSGLALRRGRVPGPGAERT
jgi:hypothetical protein